MTGYIIRMPLTAAVFLCCCIFQTDAEQCIQMISPKAGTLISTSLCTLEVESNCDDIKKVEFQSRYFLPNLDSATITSLAVINKPPFRYIWNISRISNQLFGGIAFLAEATHKNGEIEDVRREGVFFTHQTVNRREIHSNYEFQGTKYLVGDTIRFDSYRKNLSMNASVYWNEKFLTFIIDVKDPAFLSNISKDFLSEMGAEILIDPTCGKKPFPDKNTIILTAPLHGKSYRITYQPVTDDQSSFRLVSSSSPCNIPFSVSKQDYKGFTIFYPVPVDFLGTPLPEKIDCNIVIKTLDDKNNVVRSSWTKGSLYETYSPYLWNSVYFQSKPFLKNRILIWSISFLAGILLVLFIKLFIGLITRSPKFNENLESNEAEQGRYEKIKEAVEEKITNKNLSIDVISHSVHLSSRKVNYLIKKFTGLNFVNYLMYERIEIAKERLRSSHSSEESIAELCGFQNTGEFEKYFLKFHKVTPYKFRMEQQVS